MTIPSFIEAPRFELPRGWQYDVEPMIPTDIIERATNIESRNLRVQNFRTRISVTVPRERVSDIPYARRFYRAVKGRTVGFRVQDPTDYLSTAQGFATYAEDAQPTATDQSLVEIEESGGSQYELWKQYAIGEGTIEIADLRRIRKPVEGTILVANELGAAQAADRWSIDYTTGILTVQPGFVGVPTFWGGQFDIPARFDSEFPMRVEDFRVDEVAFTLLELPPRNL